MICTLACSAASRLPARSNRSANVIKIAGREAASAGLLLANRRVRLRQAVPEDVPSKQPCADRLVLPVPAFYEMPCTIKPAAVNPMLPRVPGSFPSAAQVGFHDADRPKKNHGKCQNIEAEQDIVG